MVLNSKMLFNQLNFGVLTFKFQKTKWPPFSHIFCHNLKFRQHRTLKMVTMPMFAILRIPNCLLPKLELVWFAAMLNSKMAAMNLEIVVVYFEFLIFFTGKIQFFFL